MKIIWHIIKKDLRHCRWMLLALVALWLVKAQLLMMSGLRDRAYNDNDIFPIQTPLNGIVMADMINHNFGRTNLFGPLLIFACFADIGLLVLIILKVLKEDSAIDVRTWWRTQPIARGQMLAAKMLFIGLVAFPILFLIQAGVGLAVHNAVVHADILGYQPYFNPGWLDCAKGVMLTQACWAAVAALVASLWNNRVVGGGAMVALTLAGALLSQSFHSYNNGDYWVYRETLLFTICCIGLAGSVLITAVMYLKSNRAAGFSLLATMIALIYAAILFL